MKTGKKGGLRYDAYITQRWYGRGRRAILSCTHIIEDLSSSIDGGVMKRQQPEDIKHGGHCMACGRWIPALAEPSSRAIGRS